MSDLKKTVEDVMVKVVEDARQILGYAPPKVKDDDPRLDKNDELPEDDWRRDR